MSRLRLTIVIPVYGNWEDTLDCLRKLAAQSTADFRVLIADDGSPAPAPSELGGFSFAEYLPYPHRGFAETCNAAARVAVERGSTHLLFLNNDTSFSMAFVQRWLYRLNDLPDAILSPIIYWFGKPSSVWSSGGNLTIWTPFFRKRREYTEIAPVEVMTGCALMVPASRWQELGGFDHRYVTYFEDFDFLVRAGKKGISAFIVPDQELHVFHKVSRSFGGRNAWRGQYRILASSLLFIREHYRGPRRWLCLALRCAHVVAITILCLPGLPQPRRLWQSVVRGVAD